MVAIGRGASPLRKTIDAHLSMPPNRRARVRWLIAAGIVAAIAIALRASLPGALSFGLTRWLEARGARDVAVDTVELDLTAGRLALRGLSFTADGTATRIAEAGMSFAWTDSGRHHLRLNAVEIAGLQTAVAIDAAGRTRIAGLDFDGGAAESPAAVPALTIDLAVLRDARIALTDADHTHRLVLDELRLGASLTADATAAGASIAGAWDDAPIAATGIWAARGDERSLNARVDAPRLPFDTVVAHLRPWIDGLPELDGIGSLSAAVGWRQANRDPAALLAAVELSTDRLALRHGQTTLQTGALELRIGASGSPDALKTRIELEVAGLALEPASTVRVGATKASATWVGTLTRRDGQLVPEGRLMLDGERVSADLSATRVTAGTLVVRSDLSGPFAALATRGELSTTRLQVTRANGLAREITADAAAWRGDLALGEALRIDGRVTASGLRVGPGGDATLAGVGTIDRADLQWQADRLTIRNFSAKRLDLLGRSTDTAASIDHVDFDTLRADSAGLAIDSLRLSGLAGRIVRDADGAWWRLPDTPAETTTSGSAASEADPPYAIRIGALSIGAGSRLDFEDRSVTPNHRRDIVVDRFLLQDFSTPAERPAQIDLAATVDKHARIEARGSFLPRAGKPTADIALTARSLELPPLSGHLAKAIGQAVTSGQLDATSHLRIEDDRLDMQNELRLRRLELQSTRGADASDAGGGMPIDTALSMLRDRHGDIRLSLPVSGSPGDPKFSLADALHTATTKAMRVAALSYVKQMIQPYGALITLAELGARQLDAVRLESMRFSPGQSTFDARGIDYLEKIAALMGDRPRLRLRVCGKAWRGETEAMTGMANLSAQQRDERLLLLAQQRAEAIKSALTGAHGIVADRLFLCQPEIGNDEGLAGRADLLI